MKRAWLLAVLTGALAVALVGNANATGNGAPGGHHFTLNIIGVENPKTTPLTGGDRHTIFVALGKNGTVTTNIYLIPGPDFAVCDGNGFDAVHNCDGTPLGVNGTGASFMLPCNTNLSAGDFELISCDEPAANTAAYEVWARALSPNGEAIMRTCAFDPDINDVICSSENVILNKALSKKFQNVTQQLTSLVANIDLDAQLERVALFASNLEDWFWQYSNSGLRHAQLRFYLLGEIKHN